MAGGGGVNELKRGRGGPPPPRSPPPPPPPRPPPPPPPPGVPFFWGAQPSPHRIANSTAPPTLVGTVSGDEQAPAAIAVVLVSAAPCTVFTLPDAELGASTAP